MRDYAVLPTLPRGRDEDSREPNLLTAAASTPIPASAPTWAAAMRRFTNYLLTDFGGGPRLWKLAWVIDFEKAGTFPLLGFLIAWYHNTGTAAWIYLAMHGSYGLVFRQSSIDRFLKLEVLGIQEIPASAARQLKMDGTLGSIRLV